MVTTRHTPSSCTGHAGRAARGRGTYRVGMTRSRPAEALDWLLDKSVVLGWSKVGPAVRRLWWPADPPPDALRGKHVVVTGASGGLGLATAAGLAGLGADVHLVGRSLERLHAAERTITTEHPDARLHSSACDVGDLDAVESWCTALVGEVPSLHAIVHNAGLLPPERRTSAQGHELTLATHVLGPHLMTFRLAGALRGGRALVVSSGGMYGQALPEHDYEYAEGEYSGVKAYARTKRMQVVLAEQWAKHLAADDIHVAALHPGWGRTPGLDEALPGFVKVMGPLLRSAEGGADTTVWLAATPEQWPSGRFWQDRQPRPTHYGPLHRESAEARQRLWEFVREQTGVPAG
ncbi:NAD(P)-dependent dehydrogenase (short-subunit alcohol dehydrogenase family) [Phycicoccus sp. SLBN-51]|nr:NAD(P)-dependent dehydrogenase (short-subunit alcohol dehydrogenase family) [Phycicoccus sp. SLBN-51]